MAYRRTEHDGQVRITPRSLTHWTSQGGYRANIITPNAVLITKYTLSRFALQIDFLTDWNYRASKYLICTFGFTKHSKILA